MKKKKDEETGRRLKRKEVERRGTIRDARRTGGFE